jgi:putative transport protein
MEPLAAFLHAFPALCRFLSILLGTIIGHFHFKGVGFGSVVGTLIAGIFIGILAKPELPDMLRWAFFYLFLFAVGYSVGPQFFGSLKREAVPQIVLALWWPLAAWSLSSPSRRSSASTKAWQWDCSRAP